MSKPSIPFSAGQRSSSAMKGGTALSPMPVETNTRPLAIHDVLVSKNQTYLEIGGAGGVIFQTQLMWIMFLMGWIIPVGVTTMAGGVSQIISGLYLHVKINGQWQEVFSYFELFVLVGGFGGSIFGMCFIVYKIHANARKTLTQTLPPRFNRQRREVMFSRWNEDTKQTEYRFFPWEKVCVLVGQSSAISTGGVFTQASLLIAANDEEDYGHFWATVQIGVMTQQHGVRLWEMIRSYMEQGPDTIGEPSPLTYEELKQQHCDANDIKPEEFGPRLIWWIINGTFLGIWRQNYLIKQMVKHTRHFDEVESWSQPIPESEWAKPSKALTELNTLLKQDYQKGKNILTIGDVNKRYGLDKHQASQLQPLWQDG